jgi:hypothetical protein
VSEYKDNIKIIENDGADYDGDEDNQLEADLIVMTMIIDI